MGRKPDLASPGAMLGMVSDNEYVPNAIGAFMQVLPTFIDVDGLAQMLCLSPKTIRNTLSKNPETLPPRVVIDGLKVVRFFSEDVVNWIKNRQRSFQSAPKALSDTNTPAAQNKARRGRPTKRLLLLDAIKNNKTKG